MKFRNVLLLVVAMGIVAGTYPEVKAAACSYIINVKDYGAVGDGVADDTSAIRTALRAAGGAGSTEPRVVFFPAGEYIITKPIFLGEFSSSGNGQGSFSWAGESRKWGGGIAYATSGIHLVGETDMYGATQITYKNASSYPMFVIVGGRNHKIEKLQLNGQSDGFAKASEGIFLTAGTYGFTMEQSIIKNCIRGFRAGNNVHWPEDPIIFKDYETQDGYPTTTGGWMVEQIVFTNCRLLTNNICISMETAQTIGFVLNKIEFSDEPGGYAIYLQSGRMTLLEPGFLGNGICDIYVPPDCGTNHFQIYGGHSECSSGITFKKDRVSGYSTPPTYSFRDYLSGQSAQIKGAVNLVIEGGSWNNIDLLGNYDTGAGALQIVDIKNSRVGGKIGQKFSESHAGKVILSAENVVFTGTSTTPWNTYFDNHQVNKIVNCRFLGSSFIDSVKRLDSQGMGVFTNATDGGSQLNFGTSYDNTNTIYGTQSRIDTLKKAYRKDGSIYAAGTSGSMLSQEDSALSYSTFSGDTADTTVDSWDERFATGSNGTIWTIKVNGHQIGWNSSAPSTGTWSQGDVIYNTAFSGSGTCMWMYNGSGWIAITK